MDGTTLMPKLAEPYKKNIGKITFQVTSFGSSQGNHTAQQLHFTDFRSQSKTGAKQITDHKWLARKAAFVLLRCSIINMRPSVSVVGKDGYE